MHFRIVHELCEAVKLPDNQNNKRTEQIGNYKKQFSRFLAGLVYLVIPTLGCDCDCDFGFD